jgi:hypothetical protein
VSAPAGCIPSGDLAAGTAAKDAAGRIGRRILDVVAPEIAEATEAAA